MLSLAAKTHWKLALNSIKKAIKVTFQDIYQNRKARKYQSRIIDDLIIKRKFFELER
ncbi:hypothetical protein [Ignavibacterium sp.]|uniref:hypothetical protein n=1 Tax=Ignavibacterium sp. TaxID=2651167 RepID=UPI00307D0AB1